MLNMFPRSLLVSSCLLGFILGLLFTQRSGNYFVTMFDDYSATLPLVIVVVFETTSVAWVYGTDRWGKKRYLSAVHDNTSYFTHATHR